jgi:hypothetical protein
MFTVSPAAPSKFIVAGYTTPTTAGTAHNVTVTAADTYGNTVTGYRGTVQLVSSDAQAVLPLNYTFTSTDAGTHTFSVTLKTAGTQSITATDTTHSGISGSQMGITVTAASASQLVLTAPTSVKSGSAFSEKVTAYDPYGNVVMGYQGTVQFASSDRTANLPANYTFQSSDAGTHVFANPVLRHKGTQKLTVTDQGNPALTSNANISVT